jgi:hypothetical protein
MEDAASAMGLPMITLLEFCEARLPLPPLLLLLRQ